MRDRKAEIEKQIREAIQHGYKLLVYLTANVSTFWGPFLPSCGPVGHFRLLSQVMFWVEQLNYFPFLSFFFFLSRAFLGQAVCLLLNSLQNLHFGRL